MKKILAALLFLFSIYSINTNAFEPNNLNICNVSRPAKNNYEPEKFSPSNNLLRLPGREEFYCGQKILLKLTLKDKNCVPISDAKIYIWQVGCDGKYPYKPLRTKCDEKLLNIESKSSFVGHGTATSNNLGHANFITIYPPGKYNQEFINIRIAHPLYGTFQTQIKMSHDKVLNMGKYDVVSESITLPWEDIRRRY